jgi:hypothetical protein
VPQAVSLWPPECNVLTSQEHIRRKHREENPTPSTNSPKMSLFAITIFSVICSVEPAVRAANSLSSSCKTR